MSILRLVVNQLADENSTSIGIPGGISGTIQNGCYLPGDVNGDSSIDIIDALRVAQYDVGLDPSPFNPTDADVNCDGLINIIDALLFTQYYVGLINHFC